MKKPKRQHKTLQQHKPEDAAREPYGYRRKVNTHFLFWTVCEDRACARARACAGADPSACLLRWWPAVPEEMKIEFRALLVGVGQKGMSPDEAASYAQGEVARWKESQKEDARNWEALQALPLAPEPVKTTAVTPAIRGPRIRSL